MQRGVRLRYLTAIGRFPSGRERWYYRRKGKYTPMPDLPPDHPDFIAAYSAAHRGKPQRQSAPTGTIAAGVNAYLASDAFLSLRASTREARRRIADKIRDQRGEGTMNTLEPRHIRLDLAGRSQGAAQNRWKVWRALCRFWVDAGLLDADPSRDVRKPQLPKSDGYAAWTRDDFEAFRKRWPIGTTQRLAFELAYQTCAAAVDLVRLGPANVRDGWISYRRSKTGAESESPLVNPPAWFEPGDLQACLDARKDRHMTFLTTAKGAARSQKAVSAWFSQACTAAGLPLLSLHGVRKGRAAMFRENGASPDQRMAVLGHLTEGETHQYSKSADLRKTVTGDTKLLNLGKSAKNDV